MLNYKAASIKRLKDSGMVFFKFQAIFMVNRTPSCIIYLAKVKKLMVVLSGKQICEVASFLLCLLLWYLLELGQVHKEKYPNTERLLIFLLLSTESSWSLCENPTNMENLLLRSFLLINKIYLHTFQLVCLPSNQKLQCQLLWHIKFLHIRPNIEGLKQFKLVNDFKIDLAGCKNVFWAILIASAIFFLDALIYEIQTNFPSKT